PLLVAVYVMWLCVGLHLGVGIMGLPLMVLAWAVDRRVAIVFAMPFLSVLLVTMGLERMAGGVLVLSAATFLIFAAPQKLSGIVALVGPVGCVFGMVIACGDAVFTIPTALFARASIGVPMALRARRHREGRIMVLGLTMMLIGSSPHVYLPI